jgi:hypothetical protein
MPYRTCFPRASSLILDLVRPPCLPLYPLLSRSKGHADSLDLLPLIFCLCSNNRKALPTSDTSRAPLWQAAPTLLPRRLARPTPSPTTSKPFVPMSIPCYEQRTHQAFLAYIVRGIWVINSKDLRPKGLSGMSKAKRGDSKL